MFSLLLRVRQVFQSAQDGNIVMSRLCEQMTSLQEGSDANEFWDAFIHHVEKTVIYFKAEPAVERVVTFIANFATYSSRLKQAAVEKVNETVLTPQDESSQGSAEDEETMEPFLLACFNYFMNLNNAREKGVRLRCCQLVNKMLNLLGEEAFIDEDLSDSIYESMMIRIKDVYPPVRNQAALALHRLQDPTDEECAVIDAYLHSVAKDIHPLVRRTILTKLAISRKTLPYVIERTHDVKDIIRKSAFMILSQKVSVRALSIAQRIKLITRGLEAESSEDVTASCKDMVRAWFKTCNYKFIKLLAALDTESDQEASILALDRLFNDATFDQLKDYVKEFEEYERVDYGGTSLIDHDLLTPEIVFFWYSMCKHLQTVKDGDLVLQSILPELTNFCTYVRSFTEKNFMDSMNANLTQCEFILKHLLQIAALIDLSDEIGRKNLDELIRDLFLLKAIPITLAETLVKVYRAIKESEDSFVQSLAEIISDIRQPLVEVMSQAMKDRVRMLELQVSRLTVSIQECNEDLEFSVKQQNFQQAALLKDNITELEIQRNSVQNELEEQLEEKKTHIEPDNDPGTVLKCLTIGTSMLSECTGRGLNATLISLKDDLFFDGVANEDPCIRNEAVKGLGLICLRKKEYAAQHLVFFLQVVQVDQEFVKITAIKVIFDLFLLYGVTALSDASNVNKEENSQVQDTSATENEEEVTVIPETPEEGEEEEDDNMKEKTAAAEKVLSVLLLFLQNESSDLRTITAEGFAKMLIHGRIISSSVLSRLIILWYNPITEDDLQLRHCLGVFMPYFAFYSRTNQEIVSEAFLPTLQTITNAPESSPLSHISINNVVDLFVQLTDVRNLVNPQGTDGRPSKDTEYENHIHDSIAMKISNTILSDTSDPDVKIYCKALNQLAICPQNLFVINDLIDLSEKIMDDLDSDECSNRVARNLISKFNLHLKSLKEPKKVNEMADVTTTEGDESNVLKERTSNIMNNSGTGNTPDRNETVLGGSKKGKSKSTTAKTKVKSRVTKKSTKTNSVSFSCENINVS